MGVGFRSDGLCAALRHFDNARPRRRLREGAYKIWPFPCIWCVHVTSAMRRKGLGEKVNTLSNYVDGSRIY